MKLPTESATDYAWGRVIGGGSTKQAAKKACIYDGVSPIWWRLVRRRLMCKLKENGSDKSEGILRQ